MQYSLIPTPIANLLPFQGEAYFYPNFLSLEEADLYFNVLQDGLFWQHEPIWMFGKQILQPRLTALYGDPKVPYSYSGIAMQALPFTPELERIKQRLQDFTQHEFTHVLCNYYRDGHDSMGWHRDNEVVLGKNPKIASITFGANRSFQMRPYSGKVPKVSLELSHGSLLLMEGESQHYWEHQLPKIKKVQNSRINLTFRKLVI
ncbi:MAG: alpha-ketoglutarate-dependent dioxygenase AlkB [Bacteroidetes bacterium]|nr:alpha-ketoglutarate-dependent dioxygenase AlkB [Bacteroidota bacterium]MDA1269230.1 alpha-ketoglutarate-dependent dioxygenase AlkB [Bacteroidota bacterium]